MFDVNNGSKLKVIANAVAVLCWSYNGKIGNKFRVSQIHNGTERQTGDANSSVSETVQNHARTEG